MICWKPKSGGSPYENIEKIETFISEIFIMLGYDLTFLTYKLPKCGGFESEIVQNFGMSEKTEKIETFISENFRDSWFFSLFSLINCQILGGLSEKFSQILV